MKGRRLLSVLAATAVAIGVPFALQHEGHAQSSSVVLVGAGDLVPDCTQGYSTANALATEQLASSIAGSTGNVFVVGDTQYDNGTYTAFTNCYDPTWGLLKSRTRPATGNHEYNIPGASGYFDYFNGVGVQTGPAGDRTKGYYSYNIGSWHVVVLNSQCGSTGGWDPNGCLVGSPQEQWLRADLAASPTNNIIAMFHEPRYSSGWEEESVQPLWQALYDYGADLVISGHVHNYERLAPAGPTGALDTTYGIRQFIVGTGGKSLQAASSSPLPISEVNDGTSYGVLKLTLSSSSYSWQFVPIPGMTFTDSGTGTVHGPPPNGVVASWQMEENGGTTLVDSSGFNSNATITGTPAWVAGRSGFALSLNGSTYAVAPDSSVLNPNLISLTAWVNPSAINTQYVVKKSGSWEIGLSSAGYPFFRLNNSSTYRIDAATPQANGGWMHLAGTYDGMTMHFYVDGVEQGTGLPGPSSIAATTSPVSIGAQSDGTFTLKGLLDDVRIYNNKVLSASDIQAIVSATNSAPIVNAGPDQTIAAGGAATLSGSVYDDGSPNPPGAVTVQWSQVSGPGTTTFSNPTALWTTATFSASGTYTLKLTASDSVLTGSDTVVVGVGTGSTAATLVGYWKADEGSGTTLVDSSGLGNNGTITPTVSWITGYSGLAMRFGASGYVTVPSVSSLDITGPITLAEWVRPESTTTAYTQVLIKKGTNTTGAYELGLSSAGHAYVRLNNSSSYRVEGVTAYPTNGTWMHVAATYDGTTIRLYVNGALDASAPGPTSITSNTLALAIGATADAIGKYKGASDEMRVYRGALPLSNIQQLAGVAPTNQAPVVNAGPAQTIAYGATATLIGSVSDDGLPNPPGTVTTTWSQVSGPGTTTFGNVHATSTTATFSVAGSYTLQLSAYDGALTSTGTVVVTMTPPNQAPVVNAGLDQSIAYGAIATLAGTVSDDGLPNPPAAVTVHWTQVGGLGTAGIANPLSLTTTVTFSDPGTYTLQLSASDSALTSSDTVVITVAQPVNKAPVVNAGPDQAIVYPASASLSGTATDDGLPVPPGALTTTWSQVSGPGTTTFGNPSALTTTATFSAPGTYVLQLSAFDGALTSTDTVSIVSGAAVGYWKADEGSGTTLVDSSGSGNNGAITGAPTWVAGQFGYAIRLNGTTDYATMASSPTLDITKGITLAAWVRPEALATQYVLKKALGTTSGTAGYELGLSSTGTAFARFNLSNTYRANSVSTYPTNGTTWMHLAATYDGTTIRFYVNGVQESSVAGPASIASNTLALGFGAQPDGSGKYKGAIDEARIYNRALTATEIQTIAQPPAANQAPVVNAGPDQTVTITTGASLSGTVTDDGLPNPPGTVTTTWSQVSGPGTTTFGNASALSTTATFSTAGTYTLQLAASDSALTSTSTVVITVNPPPVNQPPVVNAGPNQAIVLPASATLSGTVTDDGLPNPPGAVTTTWSQVSGPGTTTFANAAATSTTATFSLPGTYVLQLSASDSLLTSTSTVTIFAGGLVGQWSADEGSGTTLVDSSGLANNGAIGGSPAWVTGEFASAIRLNGTTDYATMASSPTLDITNAITLAAWVKPEQLATQAVLKKAVDSTGTGGYELSLSSAGKPYVRFNNSDTYRVDATNSYPTDGATWMHVAATYDGTTIQLYVNGVQQGSVAGPPSIATNTLALGFGAQPDGTTLYMGAIDEARIYNRALTTAEIQAIAQPSTANNVAPTVNAGPAQTIPYGTAATLSGTATDDGLPNPPHALTTTWTQVSGPGTTTFANASALSTTATFSAAGSYTLQLWAFDGALTTTATVGITVSPPPNQAPVVNAGSNQTIAYGATATLSGTVTDDGLPNPPGAVAVTWSQLSGPGTTTFANPSAASTTATFSAAGSYTLQLAASDGQLTTTATVVITVNPPPPATLVGYWKADEGTGSVLNDSSGNANAAAISGKVTWITGHSGLAVRWGGNAYATAPSVPSLTITGPITVAAWIRPESTSKPSTQYLIKKGTSTVGGYELVLSSAGKVFFRLNNSSTYQVTSTTSYPTNGTWMHVAATYDGTTIRLYINGVQEASGAGPTSIASNTLALAFAAQSDGNGKYKGATDEMRIYSGALSASDILALFGQ